MARRMEYSDAVCANVQDLAICEGVIGMHYSGCRKAHPQRLFGQTIDEKLVVGMHPQWSVEFLAPRCVVIDMVEMAVRVPNGGQSVAVTQQLAHMLSRWLTIDGGSAVAGARIS